MPPQLVDAAPVDSTDALVSESGFETAPSPPTKAKNLNAPLRKLTRAEVALHAAEDDVYVIIRDRVYDVTKFAPTHPGGRVIFTYAGEDATDVFAAFHPTETNKLLGPYQVGELVQDDKDKTKPFVKDLRDLRLALRDAGLFKSSKLYYLFKCLSNVALLATSVYIATFNTLPAAVLSGLVMAVFWQQCGWLSHDFLHHQVFENRQLNNYVGYVFGNLFQGFSVAWWKNKHNTHHAVPNVHGADPDIDTMPLLAWSEHALEGFTDPAMRAQTPKFIIDHQVFFYPLLMMAARVSWALQSLLYVVQHPETPLRHIEGAGIAGHWIGLAAIMALSFSARNAVVFFLVCQAACGLLLAAVFALNHNGMTVVSSAEAKGIDFCTLQIITGRDVTPTPFIAWFAGGLNYQIEHHLFPMLPRHNFHKVQPLVISLCKKYNIPYHQTGFWEGTWEVVDRLAVVESKSRTL